MAASVSVILDISTTIPFERVSEGKIGQIRPTLFPPVAADWPKLPEDSSSILVDERRPSRPLSLY
jgi:hypothetical protein